APRGNAWAAQLFSFPRSAWECTGSAVMQNLGTGSLQLHSHAEHGNEELAVAFPRGAWERGACGCIPTRSVGTGSLRLHFHAERGNGELVVAFPRGAWER